MRILHLMLLVALLPLIPACGSTGSSSGPEVIFNIREDRELTNIVDDPAKPDYIVQKPNASWTANVKVDPGVRIEFDSGTGAEVTGSLSAVGTKDQPCIFTGSTESPGSWKGIRIKSNDVNNELTWCEVHYGGSDKYAGQHLAADIAVATSDRLKLTHTLVTDSAGAGLANPQMANLDGFASNTFKDNAKSAIVVQAFAAGQVDTDTTFSGNGTDGVHVIPGTIADSDDVTWSNIAGHYFVEDTKVNGALTIEPGVTIEMEADSGLFAMSPSGSINAVGTMDKNITITGATDAPGAWNELGFGSNNPKNDIEWVNISDGGSRRNAGLGEEANVGVAGPAMATIKNCTITNSNGWGVFIVTGGQVTPDSNTFMDNAKGPSNQSL